MRSRLFIVSMVSLASGASTGRHHHTNHHHEVRAKVASASVVDDATASAEAVIEEAEREAEQAPSGVGQTSSSDDSAAATDSEDTEGGEDGEHDDGEEHTEDSEDTEGGEDTEDGDEEENDEDSQTSRSDVPKAPTDSQTDRTAVPEASVSGQHALPTDRNRKLTPFLAAKYALQANLLEQHRLTGLLHSFQDEETFNSYVNDETKVVATEAKSHAFADMLGMMRKETRKYSTPSYLEKLHELRAKRQADELVLKENLDTAQGKFHTTLRGADEGVQKSAAMHVPTTQLWGGLLATAVTFAFMVV